MTEERKQELRRLLEEAMESLEVLRSGTESSLVAVEVYREHLQRRWTSYSENVRSALVSFTPNIVSKTTKAKLLGFIRKEFAQFIYEDKIQSASFFKKGGPYDGFPLDWLLQQLLRITIAWGIEEAVLRVDRCTEENSGSFQHFALLEGIRLNAEIPVYKGMRLVPLSDAASYLQRYLPTYFIGTAGMPEDTLHSKTMLVIDCSVSPIFHKPLPELYQVTLHIALLWSAEIWTYRILLTFRSSGSRKGTPTRKCYLLNELFRQDNGVLSRRQLPISSSGRW